MTRDKRNDPKPELTPPAQTDRSQSETSLLTPQLKAAWTDTVTPGPDARTRVWNALAKTTRSGVVSETVARVDREMAVRALGAPRTPWRAGMLATGAVSVVLLAGVVIGTRLAHPHAVPVATTRPLHDSVTRSVVTPSPALPPPTAAMPPAADSGTPRVLVKHTRPRPHATPGEVTTPPPVSTLLASTPTEPSRRDLASDLRLMRSAAKALTAGDPVTALQLLDRHDALYPNSPMAKDKTALRIMSACALGRAEALRERDAFLRAEQHSPLAERVRHACAELH